MVAPAMSDKAFVDAARLYTIVPEASDSSLSEVLDNAANEHEIEQGSLLPVKERTLLFFGMPIHNHMMVCPLMYSQTRR